MRNTCRFVSKQKNSFKKYCTKNAYFFKPQYGFFTKTWSNKAIEFAAPIWLALEFLAVAKNLGLFSSRTPRKCDFRSISAQNDE